jgi:hypothetical protein
MSENVFITIDVGQNFTTDIENIKYNIYNNSEYSIGGGRDYQLEICVEGEWRKIPGGMYNAIGFFISPKNTIPEVTPVKDIDFDFVPGHYRIIKVFGIDNLTLENQTPLGYSLLTYAEFDVK